MTVDRKGIIVCIDDEQTVLDTLKEQLSLHFGKTHSVLTSISGEEAIELIDTVRADGQIIELIICDQVMPGMKGNEVLQKVHEVLPDTIKILLTGHAGLDSAISAINTGGLNRYLEKPWNMESLKDDIQGLIDKFRQKIENKYLINNLENRLKELESELSKK